MINRFDGDGIEINGASNVTVVGNFIGATQDGGGSFIKPQNVGVHVINSADNTIGGTTAADRNVISGNGNGIIIEGAGATGNDVLGNFVGISADGEIEVPNDVAGVVINGNLELPDCFLDVLDQRFGLVLTTAPDCTCTRRCGLIEADCP